MSVKRIIEVAVENIRHKITVLNSPDSSLKEIGEALKSLVGDDPNFWQAQARNYRRRHQAAAKQADDAKPKAAVVQTVTPGKPQLVAAKSAPSTAPARTLDSRPPRQSPEERRDSWLKLLSAFVAGHKRIDPAETCRFTASVFRSGVELVREHWEVFFAAMQKAMENGFYILDKGADPDKCFAEAPNDLLDRYVFGPDGMMVNVLTNFNKLEEGKGMPRWLVGKAFMLVSAIDALDRDPEDPEKGKLGDHEVSRVDALLAAVEAFNGPPDLIERIRVITGTGDPGADNGDNGTKVDPKWHGDNRMAEALKGVAVKAS